MTSPRAAYKHTFSSLLKQKPAIQSKHSTVRPKGNMAVSMRDIDPAFQGAGQKAGLEIWRIENLRPVLVPKSSHGNFFTGDAYVILKTTALKNGSSRHDIHYWLGKDTSQDEAGAAAVKTVELDAALGGHAVQYREVQGNETEKFLSYFKPCIIPQEGGVASGFKQTEVNESDHVTRLFVCKGKHVVHVKEVPFVRSSLNHDDIFILDTKSKVFQFNGSNSSIQERAKALEVVQYIKDTYHEGKCEVASVEDGKLMADAEAGEFWGFFGGFAPLPRKAISRENGKEETFTIKLFCVHKGQAAPVSAEPLKRELLDTNKCYLLDCGVEIFVWMGRETSLEERKSSSAAAEELLRDPNRPNCNIIRIIEGFETVIFRSKFDKWPQTTGVAVSEEGRTKVAALLKRQGLNVRGLMKASPAKEEIQPYIDCTGNLQVWRVNGKDKIHLSSSDQSKFYSGDCYVFDYTYAGDNGEEYLIGTWFGKRSVEEERTAAISLASKMIESVKFQAVQARILEGKEPIQFFSIFQSLVVYKGGVSSGYKNFLTENGISDETYSEDGIALFRVQGSAPDNMQAIQVDAVAASLNSSNCYILHKGDTVYTWSGSFTTSVDQELLERQLDILKLNPQARPQKEGSETEQFWILLGGKSEIPSQKIPREQENDPHLFTCNFTKGGKLKVAEIFNFTQDDLMTEDIFILDCHSCVFVWVGQQLDSGDKSQALNIGEKFLELDVLMEDLSRETPVYIVMEGCEPQFFTRFFSWDSAKSAMIGNSFQRKLSIVKNGVLPTSDKPKRRLPSSHIGRSAVPEKQRSSRSISFSPERVRVRGRSPAFNALAANFENPNARNLSTPPPVVKKPHPRSVSPDSGKLPAKSSAIAALSASFERPVQNLIPKSIKGATNKPKQEGDTKDNTTPMSNRIEALSIQEDTKEGEPEDGEGLPIYPYERLTTTSADPVTEIDATRREAYLSRAEFRVKFGMTKEAFSKLPKWKQSRLKMALQLF